MSMVSRWLRKRSVGLLLQTAPRAVALREGALLWLGRSLPDEYAWMRTDNVDAQLTLEKRFLERVLHASGVRALADSWAQHLNTLTSNLQGPSVPEVSGAYEYYRDTTASGDTFQAIMRRHIVSAHESVLIDAGLIDELSEGNGADVGVLKVSPDDRLGAFTLDCSGTEQFTLFVRDLATGVMLPDVIERVRSMAWANDSQTLLYTRCNDSGRPYRAYRRTLGTQQDALLFEELDERFFTDVSTTKDKKYFIITSTSKKSTEVYVLNASDIRKPLRLLRRREDGVQYYVEHNHGYFYMVNNAGGSEEFCISRVLADTDDLSEKWETVIPSRPGLSIEDADFFKGRIVVYVRHNAQCFVEDYQLDGKEIKGPFRLADPEITQAGVWSPGANVRFNSDSLRVSFSTPTQPDIEYDYMFKDKCLVELSREPAAEKLMSGFACTLIEATSHDGTIIPMTLVHAKNFDRCHNNRVLMVGYGAYGESLDANFEARNYPLLQSGAVLALCHVRGGGEFGQKWHREGSRLCKMNSFLDFIACAMALIDQGITQPRLLGAYGSSAGGLLVGAVLNMRPELFQAAILSVPFVDVLTAMTDRSLPLTVHEYDEWGDPSDEKVFSYLRDYDPYHNLKPQVYPSVLVTTALHDQRVPFWGPMKYASRLRACQADPQRPTLLQVLDSGHNYHQSSPNKQTEQLLLEYSFIINSLDS